jgi:hypothetical protein
VKVNINPAGTRFTLLEAEDYPVFGITVPAGYTTDFASTPKAIWWVYPPTGYYQHAATLHDWIYDLHHRNATVIGRAEADGILRKQMDLDGVGFRTRWTFWIFVRLFGWTFWNRKP